MTNTPLSREHVIEIELAILSGAFGNSDVERWSATDAALRAEVAALKGTPAARFLWILAELQQRFPDLDPFKSPPPELYYLAAIDALRAEVTKFQGLFSDYMEPPRTFDQAEIMWNTLKAQLDAVTRERDEHLENLSLCKGNELAEELSRSQATITRYKECLGDLYDLSEVVRVRVHNDHSWFIDQGAREGVGHRTPEPDPRDATITAQAEAIRRVRDIILGWMKSRNLTHTWSIADADQDCAICIIDALLNEHALAQQAGEGA